jgi:hypothetical protein
MISLKEVLFLFLVFVGRILYTYIYVATTIYSLNMKGVNIINCYIIFHMSNHHYIIYHIILYST